MGRFGGSAEAGGLRTPPLGLSRLLFSIYTLLHQAQEYPLPYYGVTSTVLSLALSFLVPAQGSDYCRRPLSALVGRVRYSEGVSVDQIGTEVFGPYSAPEYLEPLRTGAPIPGAVLIVHANDDSTYEAPSAELSARLLQSPDYQKMPRVVLGSNGYPARNPALLAQTTAVIDSWGPLPGLKLNTDKFHLAGLYLGYCVSNTLREVAHLHFADTEDAVPHFFIHTSATLDGNHDGLTIAAYLDKAPKGSQRKILKELAEDLIGGDPTSDDYRWLEDKYRLQAQESDMVYRFARQDGRELMVEFVD